MLRLESGAITFSEGSEGTYCVPTIAREEGAGEDEEEGRAEQTIGEAEGRGTCGREGAWEGAEERGSWRRGRSRRRGKSLDGGGREGPRQRPGGEAGGGLGEAREAGWVRKRKRGGRGGTGGNEMH
ncbi:hypothetical protein CYMTET_22041 [Cymbomonas tetramitiformis]|uniref:Uncharacterized protein n=1 Tax=Cymbomonas tetramitiformis TaxID=36881 RepID=A0AAE0G0Z0_9CHLO|nr:hypothetical protein CYMTET_22041 [Cymbomonas tetramitiformis]